MKKKLLFFPKNIVALGSLGLFFLVLVLVLNILPNQSSIVSQAAAPSGFTQRQVVSGLSQPTAMAIAPDGRIFVAEKGGRLRIVKNGSLLQTPFLTISVSTSGERGLLGVALDPQFSQNRFVYVYYTDNSPVVNRVSRFTASSTNPDVVQSGSEDILLDNIPSNAIYHNGGAVHFGTDGKLYIAVGDNQNGSNAQSSSTLAGKVLRINKDGSIPSDNPFYTSTTGNNRAIWARGFRNPFTFAVNPENGMIFVNDVGSNGPAKREEINRLIKGANYGWPNCEGSCSNSAYTNPIYFYGAGVGSTIAGGAFYTGTQFPQEYRGRYFFGDFLGGWIKRLNPSTNQTADFASGLGAPVDVDMGPDGALYFVSHYAGSISKIFHGPTAPTMPPTQVTPTRSPTPTTRPNSPTATPTRAPTPTGTANRPPVATVSTPAVNTKYRAGDIISFSGIATDPEDGVLPASAFSWIIETVHNDDHTHPFEIINDIKSGSIRTLNELGESSANIKYRITLDVRDSKGLTSRVVRDVLPTSSTFTVTTNPPGLTVLIDSQPKLAPHTTSGVVGYKRVISTQIGQSKNGVNYQFTSWSDGMPLTHTIETPATTTTYTANFQTLSGPTRTPTPSIRSTPVPTRTPTPSNIQPTPTPKPGAFIVSLDLLLHGIGRGGDGVNPQGQGNSNPLTKSRPITLEIFGPQNPQTLIATTQGFVTYDANAGSYKGVLSIGHNLENGDYLIRIKSQGYLVLSTQGALAKDQVVSIPPQALITGDTDSNNTLDILDYNNLLSCFGNRLNQSACIFKKTTDFDDNGVVDGVDYNLFLRELISL